ncbi:Ubiquitin carboxyl-terminal hydrolase 5 [Echinococcus granulosus]|nr:Ubiquitin carboxyl-terminal hydrolase 5 [Echinococcus granulosus]
MEAEANERLGEWLTLQEADRTLTPLHGPGVTGLVNLGNTCYINSAVEVLMATEAFRGRYALALPSYVKVAMDAVAHNGSATAVVESFGLQMSKLGQVLWFGVYSIPPVGIGEMKGGGGTQTTWTGVPPAPTLSPSLTSEYADQTSHAVPPLPDEEVIALPCGMQRLSTPTTWRRWQSRFPQPLRKLLVLKPSLAYSFNANVVFS